MSTPSPSYVCRNGLAVAYFVLKTKLGRFLDSGHISPLEDFYDRVGRANGLSLNQYTLNNSEVEQFYLNQMSETNFVATAESRLVRAALSPVGSPLSSLNNCPLGNGTTVSTGQPGLTSAEVRLLSVIWDIYSAVSDISPVSSKIPRVCGMCLWQMFLCLDKDGQNQVPIADVYELIKLIFKFSGRSVDIETVEEWFCGERMVDFRCFLQSLVEGYAGLLQENSIQDLYTKLCLKQLKQGKLMKKGHVVHNWKWRWFSLTTADIRYYESQESNVPKGCISITGSSQVQTMPTTKGHPSKFRVTDGNNGTPTEISCPDEQTRREWMDAIRLAVKLCSVEGRNFVHCYSQALEAANKSSRGMVVKVLKDGTTVSSPPTSPTHKVLESSKSAPLDAAPPRKDVGKGKKQYAMTPQDEHHSLGIQHQSFDETEEVFHGGGGADEPPPLPPQRLDSRDIRNLRLNRPALAEYDVQGLGVSQNKPTRISLRRTSSDGDLEESIKHLRVGDDDYALVSKVAKKNEKKKTSVPTTLQEVFDQRNHSQSPNGQRSPAQGPPPVTNRKPSPPMRRKKSPPLPFQRKKSQDNLMDGNGARSNQPAPPPSGPPPPPKPYGNMNYAQLNFSPEGARGGEFVGEERLSSGPKASGFDPLSRVRGGGSREEDVPAVSAISYDPKTKFDYSTILFDEAKRKDIITAERLKKERGAPPPIPNKYHGEGKKVKKLRPYVSDTNTTVSSLPQPKEQKFQGKARPISAGANRTPAASGLGTGNGIKPAPSSSSNGDYEVMDSEFWDEEEFENVPQKAKSSNTCSANGSGRIVGSYSTQPPPIADRQASSSSGYENVDVDMNDNGRWDRQNQPLPPLPSRELSSRPQQLIKSVQLNGGGPPLPKPRVNPRKYVTTPSHQNPPVPPRKIS